MSLSYLTPGVDLLSLPCITKADVQQAIAAATPFGNSTYKVGFVIVSDAAPDVVATPELANFIWLKSNLLVPTGEFYYYNGSSWTLLSVVDGNLIANNSIPLSKISLTGAVAYNIIQVNAAGNALQYVSIPNAIQNGTIPLNKLVGGAAGNFGLVSLAGVNQYVSLASLVNYFATNTIPIRTLVRGGVSAHGLFLRTFEDGTVIEWADFDPNEQIDNEELEIQKLKGSSLTLGSGQAFRRNSTNNGWEAFTPLTSAPAKKYAYVTDRVASGGAPDSAVYGAWTTKRLQTLINPDALITGLGSNQFGLIAGNYFIHGQFHANQMYVRARIQDVSSPATLRQFVQTRQLNNSGSIYAFSGFISLAATKTCELQYYSQNDGAGSPLNQFGYPMSTGDDEIYTELLIQQI